MNILVGCFILVYFFTHYYEFVNGLNGLISTVMPYQEDNKTFEEIYIPTLENDTYEPLPINISSEMVNKLMQEENYDGERQIFTMEVDTTDLYGVDSGVEIVE